MGKSRVLAVSYAIAFVSCLASSSVVGQTISVNIKQTSSWEGAFRGELVIKNNGSQISNGWQLGCDSRFTITDAWGAEWSQIDQQVTFNNSSWATSIPSDGRVVINFGGAPEFTDTPLSNCVFNEQAVSVRILTGAEEGSATQSITFDGLDTEEQIIYQHTVVQGISTLAITGVSNPTVTTNNDKVLAVSASGNQITLNGLSAGRASLKITDGASKTRYLGIRVKHTDGRNPGMPDYLAVGSVSEDTPADLAFWRSFEPGKNKRVDIRYIYLNGGPYPLVQAGWATPQNLMNSKGGRAISFIRESLKYGIIPSFVYYNIPDGNESYTRNKSHLIDPEYMKAYFGDLKYALDIINKEAGDELVQMILEPDALGYMAQNNEDPVTSYVYTQAAYDLGLLSASDPQFPNTLKGLVQAVNFLIEREAPNVKFGWQMNLWAIKPGGYTTPIGVKGVVHITDEGPAHQGYLGWEQGRPKVYEEAAAITDYYLRAGIATYGADFVSIDKYGLDAVAYGGDAAIDVASQPAESTWFWNADHWNNYLLFVKAIKDKSQLPVVLWQIPVGHVNSSLASSAYHSSGQFPDLPNTVMKYEDSAPSYFFGDSFKPGSAARMAHFSMNQAGDPDVQVRGDTIYWGEHMSETVDAGVTAILFGAGVGMSTDGVGLSQTHPTDGFYWISRVQEYLEQSTVPLN